MMMMWNFKSSKGRRIITLLAVAVLLITQSVVYFYACVDVTRVQRDVELKAEAMLAVTDGLTASFFEAEDRVAYVDSLRRALPLANLRFEGLSLFFYENDSIKYWGGNLYRTDVRGSTSSSATTVERFDDAEVLTFYEHKDSLTSVAVVLLSNPAMGSNERLLGSVNGSLNIYAAAPTALKTGRELVEVNIRDKGFYFEYHSGEEVPFVINILGWLGVVMLLYVVRVWLGSKLTKHNSWQLLLVLLSTFGAIRVLLFYVEVPQGVAHSWVSPGSLLLTQIMLFVIAEICYSERHSFRAQISTMGRLGQLAAFFAVTLFSCMLIAYFQFSMVSLLYINALDSEIQNIFSFNIGTLIFYVFCAFFAATRIVSTCFWVILFAKYPYWLRALVSVALISVIALLINPYIGYTGLMLVLFHIALLVLSYYSRSLKMGRIFMLKLLFLAIYVTYFIVVEYGAARDRVAYDYKDKITHNVGWESENIEPLSKSIWYAVIKDDRVMTSKNSLFDPAELTQMIKMVPREVFEDGARKYFISIRAADGATVVISTAKTSLLQVVSLWCYLFLFMLILSGAVLQFSGVTIYRNYTKRSLLYRVRTVIFVAIVGSMIVVCFVVYSYMRELSVETQRSNHRWTMAQIKESLYDYMRCWQDNYYHAVQRDEVMRRWLSMVRQTNNVDITLFDTTGHNMVSIATAPALYRISDRALCRLKYDSLSYHEYVYSVNEMMYTASYVPIYDYFAERGAGCVSGQAAAQVDWETLKYRDSRRSADSFIGFRHNHPTIAYLSIIGSQKLELMYHYDKLNDIFNLFVILFLVTIFLSMFFYWLISRPLGVLYRGLSGVGRMSKIRINSSIRLDNEVGAIIVQYNQLIDYLAVSYQAIAKSEREGAWREMARQVAHEIKNPLTPMRLKIQILKRYRNGDCEAYREHVDSTLSVLLEQIDVLARIASEFSDMARVSQTNITAIDLVGLLDNCVSLYSVRDGLTVTFINEARPKVLVRADYAAMNRVIINLLQNAIEASDAGECVVDVRLKVEGSNAVIDIEDNGRGISQEALVKMFEPNFSTKSRGSGLGLAICRGVVDSFGGTIEGRNVERGGALFVITLSLK